MVELVIAV